jgi:hypothetical protein
VAGLAPRSKRADRHDLANLCAGAGQDLGLHSDTINEICLQYAKARKQSRKPRLKWRSRKHSLSWIPFKVRAIQLVDDAVIYPGSRLSLVALSSRPGPD